MDVKTKDSASSSKVVSGNQKKSNKWSYLDKRITWFVGGVAFLFSIASIFLMPPDDMRRWVLDKGSNQEKVNQALTSPSSRLLELERALSKSSENLAKVNGFLDDERNLHQQKIERLKTLERTLEISKNENLELSKTLDEVSIANRNLTSKITSLESSSNVPSIERKSGDMGQYNLEGQSIYLYFSDSDVNRALKVKNMLEGLGLKVTLKSECPTYFHTRSSTYKPQWDNLYYKSEENLEAAVRVLEALKNEDSGKKLVAKYKWNVSLYHTEHRDQEFVACISQ